MERFASDATTWKRDWENVRDVRSGPQSIAMEVKRKGEALSRFLKELKGQRHPENRFRFNREAEILASLDTVGVPKLIETNAHHYQDRGYRLYLVTEWVPGQKLSDLVSGSHFSARLGIEIILQLCKILKVAHSRGILHRDIKPDNVIVDFHEDILPRTSLLDFGIAFYDDESDFTTEGREVGNRFFRLPEFTPESGHKDDPRSDVTMLVGLLYYMLTSKKPEQLLNHLDEPPQQRSEARERLRHCGLNTEQLLALFDKGFRLDIERRLLSISDLETRLEAIAADTPEITTPQPSREQILARLNRPAHEEIIARRKSLSSLLGQTEAALQFHYNRYSAWITMGQTNRNTDTKRGFEETTRIFTLLANPTVSMRTTIRVEAVGKEALIRISTAGFAESRLRINDGAPLSSDDKDALGAYLDRLLDVLASNAEGITDEARREFESRALTLANTLISGMRESILAYLESEEASLFAPVAPPRLQAAKIVGEAAIAQVWGSAMLLGRIDYLQLNGVSKVLIEAWPGQERVHTQQAITVTNTPGPTGSGPAKQLAAPADSLVSFSPSVDDISLAATSLLRKGER